MREWFNGKKTLVGLLVTFLAALAQDFGLDVPKDATDQVIPLIDQMLLYGGILFAAFGRIVAKKAIATAEPLQ